MRKSQLMKSLLIVLFSLMTFRVAAPDMKVAYITVSDPVDVYDRLIYAIVQVESLGNTKAYNFLEEATGAFQIRPIRLLDYNRRTGSKYKIQDCYDYNISKKIFLYYANQIGFPKYERIARRWNGSGETTHEYWEKVSAFLR